MRGDASGRTVGSRPTSGRNCSDHRAPPDIARWEPDIAAFEASDRHSPPPEGGVVFVGSSSIRMWDTLARDFPEAGVINRGFGGSRVRDSVHYAHRIVGA
ncbi:hypothetical protein [Novilysobacter selenitireducens]|uniref:hypothetical protein n=1 Tax=Novilysobacter selenitireducens TaxID=2872639 RepID=UPI001CBE7D17|nr:hypothetical protein [Lysobacter selenitireducens]